MPLLTMPDGRALEYVLEGDGDQAVVFSQPTWWTLWPWLIDGAPRLNRRFRTLAINHRGMGASSPTPPPYRFDDLCGDFEAALDALDIRQAHLVGFAKGCWLALTLAARRPDLVRTLVLGAAGDPGSQNAEDTIRKRTEGRDYEDVIKSYPLNDDFAFTPEVYRAHPERPQRLADAMWQGVGPLEEHIKHHAGVPGSVRLADCAAIIQPALVLTGDEDHVSRGSTTPFEMSQQLARALPNARLEVLPHTRHMLFWERPDECWSLAEEFLRA